MNRTLLALVGTAALWASAFPGIKIGLPGYGVAGLSFGRLLVAAVALAALAPLWKVRLPARSDLPLIALCGLAGMSAYQILLNRGETHVPAGTASLLVASAPVFSVLLSGERATVRIAAGSLVALGGCAVIAVEGGRVGYSSAAWIVLAAALCQGVYHAATKPLLRRYSGREVACYAIWSGTLFLVPLAPEAWHGVVTAPRSATLAVLYLGLVPSALGFVTWGYGVAHSTVPAATAVLYLVPVVALGVSYLWLGEVPTLVELVGGAISIAGTILIRTGTDPDPAPGNARAGRDDQPRDVPVGG